MRQTQRRRGCRVVVDTSVVIAGISAFKRPLVPGKNSSAVMLQKWALTSRFIWLVTPDILEEYKEIAMRLNVRANVARRLINLLREEAEEVQVGKIVELSPDPGDNCFCGCAEAGHADFLVTLNPRDFPEKKLSARVVSPGELLDLIRHRQRLQ